MTGHFDKNLNLRQLILDRRPATILEVGCGEGALTKLLAHMELWYPCHVMAISDKELEIDNVEWITGVSYIEIPKLADNSLELVILDTDHNYWTLIRELEALIPKIKEGGVIVMHDVDEFYFSTGMAMSYWDDTPYPAKEIEDCAKHGGLGLALIDFLAAQRGLFKLIRWVPEHFGCAVIERRTTVNTTIVKPGSAPVFAKPAAEPKV